VVNSRDREVILLAKFLFNPLILMEEKKFPLYYKFYQLLKFLYLMVQNFPREHKYTLGREIIKKSWQCLDLILGINAVPKDQKKFLLQKLSLTFDQLKIRLRMSQEVKIISVNQFAHLYTNYLKEIGDMIGGFMKWGQRF